MNNETFDWNSRDHLFDEVVAYAQGQKRLTASGIIERFGIGFNRANRIIRQIEESGVLTSKENDNERVQD
jgi:DNA segregation ATPase FtsK/SpoIIIE-like protein